MKRYICTIFVASCIFTASAQQTQFVNDRQEKFKQAKEYYQKAYYSLAYPLFKELNLNLHQSDRSNDALSYQEIKYYTIVCALKQNEEGAVLKARKFIEVEHNSARVQMMSFHLAEYFFP